MTLWNLVWLIIGCGALGGIANCAITGEFVLPSIDKQKGIWRPGWIGNIVVGAIAALVIGGMYGPLSEIIITSDVSGSEIPKMQLAQLLGGVVVGLGGGNILTQLAQRNADRIVKGNLANTMLSNLGDEEQKPPKTPTT